MYTEQLQQAYAVRLNKPLWTRERIREVIGYIEEYEKAPKVDRKRTSKLYFYQRTYNVVKVGGEKFLTLKRKSVDDAYTKIVPSEEYFDLILDIHKSNFSAVRDVMIKTLKDMHLMVPILAIRGGQLLKYQRHLFNKRSVSQRFEARVTWSCTKYYDVNPCKVKVITVGDEIIHFSELNGQILTTSKGGQVLLLGSHRFHREYGREGRSYWRCTKRNVYSCKCNVRIINQKIYVLGQHSHH
ncbi:FLYWCH zinc finger domain-containing protein [Phthorimaea operculella]|nr:FLYWCH zinc finger domain-containing protein [Phthorimaea operculella]